MTEDRGEISAFKAKLGSALIPSAIINGTAAPTMTRIFTSSPRFLFWVLFAALLPTYGFAAEADSEQSVWFWNLVISLIVMLVTVSSAALPLAALRQWHGGWFMASVAPLALLALWCAIIFLSRLDNPNSHRLWPFEIFSWAMMNMIYMVALMTYKRKADKAREMAFEHVAAQDEAESSSSD